MSLWAVEEKSKPRPSKNGRVGHPEGQRPGKYKIQCLVDDVQQWYYSMVKKYQSKKQQKGAPHAGVFADPDEDSSYGARNYNGGLCIKLAEHERGFSLSQAQQYCGLPNSRGQKDQPQTQAPDKSHQCLVKAAGTFALHGGGDALGFIPEVGGAAVVLFSGYAVTLIDSTTPEGVTARSVGTNALGTGLFIGLANKASIAKFSSRLAEGIPILGTALTTGQLIYDGIHAYNQYQACVAGGN
jgi:hypothetical protein